jgi:hypothetical protein
MCCGKGDLWKPQALRLWLPQFQPKTQPSRTGNRRLQACGGISFNLPEGPKLKLRRGEPGGVFEEGAVVVRSKLTNRRGEPGGVQHVEQTRSQLVLQGIVHVCWHATKDKDEVSRNPQSEFRIF